MISIIDNIPQLNGQLSLLNPLLNNILGVCLHDSYKNAIKLIWLAQVTTKPGKNHYIWTKNIVFNDGILITESLSTNILVF